jgi:hypothetical protein
MPEETIFSVYMTSGQSTTINEYDVHIGKQELVSTLVGTLNGGTLHLPPDASDFSRGAPKLPGSHV